MNFSTLQPKGRIIMLTFLFMFSFGFISTTSAQCEIGEIEATPTPCDSLGFFDLVLDFDYANTGNLGFTVEGNGGIYGSFEYTDLPITIYDLEGDGVTFYEFIVRDAEYLDCSNSVELGIIYCDGGPCAIWNVDVFVQPCEAGYFYVQIGFWYENIGTEGFHVQGNGVNYGDFEYEDLPIMIGPLLGDGVTEYEFVVIDNEFEDCSDWAAIDPVECPGGGDCDIWDLVIDDHPCEEGMFSIYLNFEYENVSDSGFALYVNYDLFGWYSYDDLPLESIGSFNGDGSTVYHFLVADLMYEECAEDTNFGPIDCGSGGDCEIGEIGITILPCNDDDEFNVLLNFEYANTSDEFTVQGNGAFYGTFLYTNLPVEIGPLQGDGSTIYEFGVNDAVYDNCGNANYIDPVSCDGETAFINFTTQVVSCDDEMYELQMDFDVVNGGNQGFMIVGNGEDYGSYSYDALPVTIGSLATDGLTYYHFIAKDKENQHYGNWDRLIPFTCESLGIEESTTDEDIVNIYPNPSYGSMIFENLYGGEVSVYLYNSAGAEAASFRLVDTHQINGMNAGIYYYRIVGANGVHASGKLIVTR